MTEITQTVDGSDTTEPGFGLRHGLILFALFWTVQLLAIVSVLAGNAQSQVAIHFHTTQIAWFTLVSTLTGTFCMPFAAKIASIRGKKRTIVALTVFGLIGDVVAALAPNYATLLVGRGIAGVYVAAAPVAYALTRDVFPRRHVGVASALLGGGVGVVALVGPFLSGWIIDSHGFRGALWFMAASTLVSVLLVLFVVPESPVRERDGRMDWIGGLLLGGAVTLIVYCIGEGSAWGWSSGRFLGLTALGVVLLAAFGRVETRVAEPVFPPAMLARRPVWTVLIATSIAAGAANSVGVIMQLLALMPRIPGVSDGLGWSATRNAVATSPISILMVLVGLAAGLLARRVDSRHLFGVGVFMIVLGYGLATGLHHSAGQIVAMGVIAGPGMGLVLAVVPIMIIEAVRPEEQALANGAQSLTQGVAQAVVSQLAFVVLARRGSVLQGTQFYHDAGYVDGFWLIVGCCAVGGLLALLIPRARPLAH